MNVIYSNTISVETFCRLRKSVGFSDLPAEQAKKALERSDFIITAIVDGEVIGMARLIHDGLQVFPMDVIVCPEYQGKGIGRGIMERLMEYIQNMAVGENKIRVSLFTDKPGFYEKFGLKKGTGMLKRIGYDN